MDGDIFTWLGGALFLLGILVNVGIRGAPFFDVPRWIANVILALILGFGAVVVLRRSTPSFPVRLTVWLGCSTALLISAYWGQRQADGEPVIPPDVQVAIGAGLRPPATSEEVERLREYKFTITNNGKRQISQVVMQVQFPELIVSLPMESRDWVGDAPDGVKVRPLFAAEEPFRGSFDKKRAMWQEATDYSQTAVPAFEIRIAELYPSRPIEFFLRSQQGANFVYIYKDGSTKPVVTHVCGKYQFEQQSSLAEKRFMIPLSYNETTRAVTTLPTAPDGLCHPIITMGGIETVNLLPPGQLVPTEEELSRGKGKPGTSNLKYPLEIKGPTPR